MGNSCHNDLYNVFPFYSNLHPTPPGPHPLLAPNLWTPGRWILFSCFTSCRGDTSVCIWFNTLADSHPLLIFLILRQPLSQGDFPTVYTLHGQPSFMSHIEQQPQPFSTVSCCHQHWANGLHTGVSREIKAWPSWSHIHRRSYTCDTQEETISKWLGEVRPPWLWQLWNHRAALGWSFLAYISKLEILSPNERFPCFPDAHTTTSYCEKQQVLHRVQADELLQHTKAGVISGGGFYGRGW